MVVYFREIGIYSHVPLDLLPYNLNVGIEYCPKGYGHSTWLPPLWDEFEKACV